MAHKDDLGRAGEERAADELRRRGFSVVDRNWRCRAGELDIVAVRAGVIAAVEVKTRSGTAFGHPLEAIRSDKLRRLWRLAHLWAREHPDIARGRRVRVDAMALVGRDPTKASIDYVEDLR
ncbi:MULTISPECIES: YraN family protein [unclassified Microbacterium]|uniref:YraN family protein n=1 Tax=unclassified Microbacterium TaxID=2609290 RepID=UPI00097E81A4|nr:YraN family protein [Microbacterium sp. JB110]RCS62764.1 YraN family protein [Microbacterium sp. JB110]SJM62902.1 Endonuclease [Frigoribacterium sp. JB110]